MLTVLRHGYVGETSWCALATGRACVAHLLRCANPEIVFLPAYVPEGILQPILKSGIPHEFYRLIPGLLPDMVDFERCIAKAAAEGRRRPLMIVLHYFGYLTPSFAIEQMTHQLEGVVLHDCAHMISDFNGTYSDANSDITLYSYNKFLPVTDGAKLFSNCKHVNVSIDHQSLTEFPEKAVRFYERHLAANRRIAAARNRHEAEAHRVNSEAAYRDYYAEIVDCRPYRVTDASRTALYSVDWTRMALLRRQKVEAFDAVSGGKFKVRSGYPQLALPIDCGGKKQLIFEALEDAGVLASELVSKWDHLPDGSFVAERYFMANHLLLPIGEDVSIEDMIMMAKVVSKFA
jgi:hypothetical protein